MRPIRKVRISFLRLSDQEFYVLVYTIYIAMLENSYFESPKPTMKDLKAGLDAFSLNLSVSSRRGSPLDTVTKNESRKSLAKLVASLGHYINEVSNGNLSMLLSTGFPLVKSLSGTQVPKVVKGLRIKDGRQRGQMVISFTPQTNIRIYRFRYTSKLTEEGKYIWNEEDYFTSSSLNNIIAGLVVGTAYYVSVQAVNSYGAGDWSTPLKWIAR